jgi:hypothetical protein
MDGVPRLEISVRGDQVELILRGQAGGDYRLESSSDLIEWTVIGDVHLDEAAGLITRPRAEAREYFRATVK